MNSEPFFTAYTKTDTKWIKDLNIRARTMRSLEVNRLEKYHLKGNINVTQELIKHMLNEFPWLPIGYTADRTRKSNPDARMVHVMRTHPGRKKPNMWLSHGSPSRGLGQAAWWTGPQQQEHKSCVSVSNWHIGQLVPCHRCVWCFTTVRAHGRYGTSVPVSQADTGTTFMTLGKYVCLCSDIQQVSSLIKPQWSLLKLPSGEYAPMA